MVQGITCMVAQLSPRTGTHKLLWSLKDMLVTSTKSCQGLEPLTLVDLCSVHLVHLVFHLIFQILFIFFSLFILFLEILVQKDSFSRCKENSRHPRIRGG
jgi:hypothetical protein